MCSESTVISVTCAIVKPFVNNVIDRTLVCNETRICRCAFVTDVTRVRHSEADVIELCDVREGAEGEGGRVLTLL